MAERAGHPTLIAGDERPAPALADPRGAKYGREVSRADLTVVEALMTTESATGARNSSTKSSANAGLLRPLLCRSPG